MTHLIEVQGVSQELRRRGRAVAMRPAGPRGPDQRAHRSKRIGQDHPLQRHHRLRAHPAGRGAAIRGTEITNAPPDRVFDLGIGRTFQLTRLFMRLTVLENMLVATQRDEGWLRAVLRRAGSAGREASRHGAAGLRRHRTAGPRARRQSLLWAAQAAGAGLAARRRPRGPAPRRARRRASTPPSSGTSPTASPSSTARGKTIVVVEHNMEFVMNLCSRVTVLSQGTALVSGTPAEVRSNPAVLDAYLGGEDDASTQQELAAEAARPRVRGTAPAPATRTTRPARPRPARRRPSPWMARRRCCASRA